MRPYGEYGRPIAIFEAYREWSDMRLQEADSRADFPEFLFGPVRTALWHAYARVNPQWRRYTSVVPLTDFRERRLRGINGLRGFGYVGDHGEYPGMRRTERLPAVIALDTYGGVYSITRQLILSDDTGELLNRNPGDMGWEAGRFVGEAIVSLIESNPTAADGTAFFHSSRGNTGVAPLSEDALADAISWMEAQLDDDGNHIMIRANALLVKTARLQMIANRVLRSQETGTSVTIASAAGAGSNIFDKGTINSLEGILPADAVIREPFLTDANDWYLFADPADVPAFAVGFLNGNEQPFVGLKDPTVRNALGAGMDPYTYEFDSIDFKVRHDFGLAAVDPRGAFRSVAPYRGATPTTRRTSKMARGNDAAAATADLQSQYGDAPNAEELITMHRQQQDPLLHRASLTNIDQGATNALDLSGLEVGEGETVVAAAVRGAYVIAVIEDARGNYVKRRMDAPSGAMEKSSKNEPVSGPKVAVPEPDAPADPDEAQAEADKAAKEAEEQAAKDASAQAEASGSGPEAAAAAEEAAAPEATATKASRSSK